MIAVNQSADVDIFFSGKGLVVSGVNQNGVIIEAIDVPEFHINVIFEGGYIVR